MTCRTTHHNACECREAKFKEIEAENAELRKQTKRCWISVQDRLPINQQAEYHEYDAVLVYSPDYSQGVVMGCYATNSKRWYIHNTPSEYRVTHWMPLPGCPEKLE